MAVNNYYRERLRQFEECLDTCDEIDLKKLRTLCFDGGIIDDKSHVRSVCWKLLLGYLPANKLQWESSLIEKHNIYKQFVKELIHSNPYAQQDDHPLNPAPTSQWNQYFKDNEIVSQIHKDVRRLYPDISFFQQRIPKIYKSKSGISDIIGRTINGRAHSSDIVRTTFGATEVRDNPIRCLTAEDEINEELTDGSANEEYHWQIVARILYIYAKLNPGQGYVQGMNEIVGPIYYVFSNDNRSDWSHNAEADTFWCFTSLMSEIRDMYNSQLDSDQNIGVDSMMTRLTTLLSSQNSDLYHQITQIQYIKPHYYAFRWITLLLSQEFPLPDVLRIWDFLFADEERFSFLIDVCCAMILLLSDDLMKGDFATNMKLLQNFPDKIDVHIIIRKAKYVRTSR